MNPEATATSTDTMRAITQTRYGNSDVLRLAQVPRPVVRDDQVLIRVHAAGLDRGTEHLMTGKPYAVRLASGIRRPKNPVPGRDVAGTVVEVGAKVTRFSPGDQVYGVAPGSFAEYAVTGEDRLAHKPANLSFAEAAVIPISAGTALQALTDAGRVQPGQSVLITGASGGVGSYAVQLAASLGADVTGVCSRAKLDHVAALGAHHVIDYSRDDWADGTRRYDLILDIAGNPPVSRLRRALTPRGTAVFVGGESSGVITGMRRQVGGALLSPSSANASSCCWPVNAPPTTSGSPGSSSPASSCLPWTAATPSSVRPTRCGALRTGPSAERSPSRCDRTCVC